MATRPATAITMPGVDDELQGFVRMALREAVDYHEENFEPMAEKAREYYYGEKFGTEEEGRSQAVSRDVHDITWGQIPQLMKIFFGAEDAVYFRPRRPDMVDRSRQQTDMVRYLIEEENDGFVQFHAAFQDALVTRVGAFKWWFEENTRLESSRHTRLDTEALAVLMSDVEVEDVEVEEVVTGDEGQELANVRVYRRKPHGVIRFEAVPPEELVWTPGSRAMGRAPMIAHYRKDATRAEALALGAPEELVDKAITYANRAQDAGLERTRRRPMARSSAPDDTERDPTQKKVPLAEAYFLMGEDEEVEIRRFWAVGEHFTIFDEGEAVDEVPFAILTPYLESHQIAGLSNYDQNKDVQEIKSEVIRGMLDSLAASIEPPIVADDSYVNVGDLVNPEIGGLIRTHKNPRDVLMELPHEFVGGKTLPVLEYMDMVRQARSGWDQSASGLDPESLQSSTPEGVTAHLSASQARIELIARTFAETGVKQLYQGLLRLVIRHRNQPDTVQLRGRWVEVDPRHWHADFDVAVNIPLGQGSLGQRRAFLERVLQGQFQLMEAGAPFVRWANIRYALDELARLAGRGDSDLLFSPWGPQEDEQLAQQQAEQPPPPDPTLLLAQIEQSKVQQRAQADHVKAQLEQAKLQFEQEKEASQQALEHAKVALEQAKLEFQREKQSQDAALKELEIELKNQREVTAEEMRAQMETYRMQLDAESRREEGIRQQLAARPAPVAPSGPPEQPAPGGGGMI